jgi:hypothetical protein
MLLRKLPETNKIEIVNEANQPNKNLTGLLYTLLSTAKGVAQIQGGVFDQKKDGIPNAIIIAIDSSRNFTDSVTTDERGFYSFKGLKAGKYRIEAKARGFLTSVFRNIEAREEGPDDGIVRTDISNATRLEIVLNLPKLQNN